MKDVVVTARIEEEAHKALRAIAEVQDRSVSHLVRKAVERLVETDKASIAGGSQDAT